MPVKQQPKPPKPKAPPPKKPPKIKAKMGISNLNRAERLDLSSTYLSSQKTSAAGPQVAAETTYLQDKRDALVAREGEYSDIHAQLLAKGKQVVEADDEHDGAIEAYAFKASMVSKDDADVLKSLGVTPASVTRKVYAGPADTVTGLFTVEGDTQGSSYLRWARPPGAAAFLVRYRLEAPPGAPQNPWQPSDSGYATKNVEWLVEGLPTATTFRFQVCAIGAQVGPWSGEVIGKAR